MNTSGSLGIGRRLFGGAKVTTTATPKPPKMPKPPPDKRKGGRRGK